MRAVPWLLGGLLLVVQGGLWLGQGNLPYVMSLSRQLATQEQLNASLRERNHQVMAEVSDLREGLEMVEERARADLGMLRPNEILVQVTRPAAPIPSSAPSAP
jgi:cell division protein FtsB